VNRRRPALSRELRERVLAEFSHRCAICGKDRPQLHHIDENAANNFADNLLPLCPNHHLSDQHDPTRKVDPLLLLLFRRHKDPQMLSPRFEPVFRRLRPLVDRQDDVTFRELSAAASDLASFIARFAMGDYYFNRLHTLLDWSEPSGYSDANREQVFEDHLCRYLERLQDNLLEVIHLLVEQLRYQDWPRYDA
jgi:uncharacterized Zn-finger protein